jgi:hypothetical protein
MKAFKVITSVTTTTTYEYTMEAETADEAEEIVASGTERGYGEMIDEDTDWESEVIEKVKELKK